MVKCAKLGKELPGMPYKPFSNELGQRIYDSVSLDAWRQWIEFSKMIVNEYRLDLTSAHGQRLLHEQAEKFFFGGEAPTDTPPDYVPPKTEPPSGSGEK
jgi:Fe-S cluster biosynthesis and repair protein YggX